MAKNAEDDEQGDTSLVDLRSLVTNCEGVSQLEKKVKLIKIIETVYRSKLDFETFTLEIHQNNRSRPSDRRAK